MTDYIVSVLLRFDFSFLKISQHKFGVRSLRDKPDEMMAALYLQVSIVSQALIFVTRSRSWSFVERPGLLLLTAFIIAQLVRIIFCNVPSFLFEESLH